MCRWPKLAKWLALSALLLLGMLAACTPTSKPGFSIAVTPPQTTTTRVPPGTIISSLIPIELRGKYDAGGVQLYLICLGKGSPTVVFDAGWGGDSSTWLKIMSDLQFHTRACAYDRAGLGLSETQPGQRTCTRTAEQLHTLLANAGVEGPYMLVGHSLGGMNMLVFASQYLSETAGLVLVDSTHPDQVDQWLAQLPSTEDNEAVASLRKSLVWRNKQALPEMMNWANSLAQVRAVKSLGSPPLVVLVGVDHEKTPWGDIPSELAARLDKVWLDLHKEYLALSTDSSLIRAEHSGHFIQDDEPQVVIGAILGLVDKVRQK